MLNFKERGKAEYPEKNLPEQGRKPTTNSTHIWRRRQDSNPQATFVGGEREIRLLKKPQDEGVKIQVALPRSISYGNFYWSMNYLTNV